MVNMNTIQLIKKHITGTVIVGTTLLALYLLKEKSTASAQNYTKPNIVLILTDDLDETVFEKHNRLNELMTEQGSIRFINNFVNISLCCPSRISILRGQVAHNTGIWTNYLPNGGYRKIFEAGLENSTLGTWLHDAGYRTAFIGKYLNGYPMPGGETYIPPGWDKWFSPNGGNPYNQYNYTVNDNGTTIYYGLDEEDYLDDVLSIKASEFIRDTVTTSPGTPFFLHIPTYAPHGPTPGPLRYKWYYNNATAPHPPNFNEADVSDKPMWVQNRLLLTDIEIADLDIEYKKRRRSLEAVTDLLRNVIDTLTATGQLNNTYIFFTSDNGFHLGQHRLRYGKDTAYEEDIKVPLVIRGPGILPNQINNMLTGNIDLAPTIAELAGIVPPNFVDGRSLVQMMKGEQPEDWRKVFVWRKIFLLEHGGETIDQIQNRIDQATIDQTLEPADGFDIQSIQTGGITPFFAGLRTQDGLSYVEYSTGERELYDIVNDPFQLTNIHGIEQFVYLESIFSEWLNKLLISSGDDFRYYEENIPIV